MKCPIKLDKIHCQNCYFAPRGKCEYKKMMGKKTQQGFVTIMPMLWGMGFLAVGFVGYCLFGWYGIWGYGFISYGIFGLLLIYLKKRRKD